MGKKIGAGFGLVLLLMIAVAGAGYWGTHKISNAMILILQTDAELEEHFAGARINALDMRRYEKDVVLNIANKSDHGWACRSALREMVTIRCSSATAAKLAAHMWGEDATSHPAKVADALGELCNMVAGNFKAKVPSLADHCALSVPTVISGGDNEMQTPEPSAGCTLCTRL